MKRKIFASVVIAVSGLISAGVLTSCGPERTGWTISGVIEGANDSTLYVEQPSGPAWVIVDSVKTAKDGSFAYQAEKPFTRGQTIYRLRLGDRSVYFPIEGAESLTLNAVDSVMDSRHKLGGTAAADGFNRVDSLIADAVDNVGAVAAVNDDNLLKSLSDVILTDTTCIVSYYTIMHPVEDRMLFAPDTRLKLGLIGAVATKYKTARPNDPRTAELETLHAEARRMLNGAPATTPRTVAAQEIGRPDVNIVGKDIKGQGHSLNDLLDRGGVTLVNLIRYDDQLSSANTLALGETYDAFHDRGLEIYQVGFDPNEAHWRQTASSMPWIAVYATPAEAADFLIAYNANPLEGGPVTLLFNKNGELVKRITDPREISRAVASLF